MNAMLHVLLLLVLNGMLPQIDTASVPPELDQRDLFIRASSSSLVIIGTVIKSEGRSERVPAAELHDRLNKGTVRGGSLKTIQVDEIVCRQSDFNTHSFAPADIREPIYLFIPFNDLKLPGGQYQEELLPNRRYMLLLTDVDSHLLANSYELDPNETYYRGEEHNRGIIPLKPESKQGESERAPEVVNKVRKLCDAMRPSKPEDKLALLRILADSGDTVLQQEANLAIKSVKATIHDESR